jgi:hypothetical protein
MAAKLKQEFDRRVTTYAILHFNMKEVDYGPDGRGPDSETVDIAALGLKSAADVHDYVRGNKFYEAYSTYQVSTVAFDGITHTSARYNETPKTWFGRVQPAEELIVETFDKQADGSHVRVQKPYTEVAPGAKGLHFVRTEGYTIQVLQEGDRVFDRAANRRIWPAATGPAPDAPAPGA